MSRGRAVGRAARRALVAWLLLVPLARADEQRGMQLVRDAQAAMKTGDNEKAVELLRQARVEWPDAPLVSNTLGDALRELGRYPEAIEEYTRGERDGLEHHAEFNRAVTRHLLAEQTLEKAGVPADVAALPDGPQPEMLTAIGQADQQLQHATDEFLEALQNQPDDAARESLEALGRRGEALDAIAEELKKRQEQQQQDKKQDQDKQDQKQQDDQQKDQQKQDQKQDEQKQSEQDQKQQDEKQDQPQDQQPKQDESSDQQQQPQDQQPPPTPPEAQPQSEPRELSPEEVQQLLDRLDQLEKQARELQKAREAGRRKPVEKDW